MTLLKKDIRPLLLFPESFIRDCRIFKYFNGILNKYFWNSEDLNFEHIQIQNIQVEIAGTTTMQSS